MKIPFYPINLELIYNLKKTTTLRSEKEFKAIGLKKGDSGILKIKDRVFEVTCLGLVKIEEVGGKEKIWASEGFDHTPIKFQQTRDFLEGKIPLYLYRITQKA